jgi:hypothetical protein
MSFLIDRRGNVRFIAMGSGEAEITALNRMLEKVMQEPVEEPERAESQSTNQATTIEKNAYEDP